MSNTWGFAIVLASLAGLVAAVRSLRARGTLGPEASRKAVHLGMGLVCLLFPVLFTDARPVWALAVLACLALAALRLVPALKAEYGGVLHGVDRFSLGELYFPLGVAAVFTLAGPRPILFVIPVAILTFADAAGALVGKRYGRNHYATVEGTKSVEGSLAVGLVGALCAAIPLAAGGHRALAVVMIAPLIGLFCLLVEAISWRGLDNLFMPLAAFAQISVYLGMTEAQLLARLTVLVALTLAACYWRRGKWVDGSARLGAALALYYFWSIGGWTWLIAPLLLIASYVRLMPPPPTAAAVHNLAAVICVGATAVGWCAAEAFRPGGGWLWPFTISLATQQAIIAVVRFSQARPAWGRGRWWAVGTFPAIALHFTAFSIVKGEDAWADHRYVAGGAIVATAAGLFAAWERRLQEPEDLGARWWKQGLTAFTASMMALLAIRL